MKQFFQMLLLGALLGGLATQKANAAPLDDLKPTVILVSLDAFKPAYLGQYAAPNLNAMAATGVRAQWMTPAYPALTFPNHYTLATGLYPEHHGIVGNSIYDPNFDATFGLSKREAVEDGRWWGGEPIWVTAEKQGQRAATYFFPGSEAEIGGVRPTYWKHFDDSIPNNERIDTTLGWLDLPAAERPTFFTLYFDEVDHAGHEGGPDSPGVAAAVKSVDDAMARLIAGLKARGVYDRVNLIIVSDHGMVAQPATNVVLLDNYFDLGLAKQITWSSQVVGIFPQAEQEDAIYNALKAQATPHMQVYRKADVPARFHYNEGPRIAPIICIAEEGWAMTQKGRYNEARAKTQGIKGAHGYDNQLESMRAIFLAHGPAFKAPSVVEPFPNTDVYEIMTRILGLKAAPNDGDGVGAREVLK